MHIYTSQTEPKLHGWECMYVSSIWRWPNRKKKSQSHLILIRQLINVQERDKLHEQSAPANRVEQSSLNGSTFNSKATNTH
jgi:hypothetical protein